MRIEILWLCIGLIVFVLLNPSPTFSESDKYFTDTDVGTYEISLKTIPSPPSVGETTRLVVEVLTKPVRQAQVHVDYEVLILKDGQSVYSTSAKHTNSGTATVSYTFDSAGEYHVGVLIDGILFSPIPTETASFKLQIGEMEDKSEKIDIETKTMPSETTSKTNIPSWIKQIAEFWIAEEIDDKGFVQVIEYLVQQDIITIPYAKASEGGAGVSIPSWIKTTAEFWIKGDTSDDEFAIGLEWLINNGIIAVS